MKGEGAIPIWKLSRLDLALADPAAAASTAPSSSTLATPGTAIPAALGQVNRLWVLVLVLGFPLLMLLLSEAQRWLRRHQPAFVAPLAIVLSSVWGADLGGFLTALGMGSLMPGLALQDSLGNIFSGVALLFEQPIGMGDWVEIGESLGQVVEVNWRAVLLQTTNDDLMVIPNTELAKGQFTNDSRPTPRHRVEIPISFSYDDPPNRVRLRRP